MLLNNLFLYITSKYYDLVIFFHDKTFTYYQNIRKIGSSFHFPWTNITNNWH